MNQLKNIAPLEVVEETGEVTSTGILGAESTHEFIRYFVASAIALAIDFGTLWILTSIFLVPYLISGAIAFATGLVVIYSLSIWWVFTKRSVRNRGIEFLFFSVIGIVGLLLNEIILWFFTDSLNLFYLFSKIISVGVVFSWNFLARKTLLFSSYE